MKSPYDVMDTTDKPIKDFILSCDKLQESKFIIAQIELSNLLRIIAGSKKLYNVIKECTEGFDFPIQLKKAKRESMGLMTIKLDGMPRGNQIALVFSILYSFDSKKLDMQKFIHTYFRGENVAVEYASFCKKLLLPFKNHVLDMLGEEGRTAVEQSPNIKNPPQIVEENVDAELPSSNVFNNKKGGWESDSSSSEIEPYKEEVDHRFASEPEQDENYLSDSQAEVLLQLLAEIVKIASTSTLEIQDRDEILLLCDSFEKTLDFGDINSARIMYIALKNTLKASPISRKFTSQIQSLIHHATEYNI